METSVSPVWRKSDQRLVNQAFVSFLIVLFLAAVVAGLYFMSPRQTTVLGTQTTGTGSNSGSQIP